ncbi:hypothetical protein [Lyngbya aestuarii]
MLYATEFALRDFLLMLYELQCSPFERGRALVIDRIGEKLT